MARIYEMTDTWNSGSTTFQAIKMTVTDTASAVDSSLLQLVVGATTEFDISKVGHVSANTLSLSGNVTSNVSFSETVFIGGDVYIYGNAYVSGNTAVIDVTELTVSDKNIVLANASPTPLASDGAGITIDGADATFTYNYSLDSLVSNKPLVSNGSFSVDSVVGTAEGTTLAFGESSITAKNILHPFLLMGV